MKQFPISTPRTESTFTGSPLPRLERAHERTKTLEPGLYMGKVKLYGVSDAWKKLLPSANFLVKYNKKETGDALQGDSALELTAAKYGRDEWWLLLEPAPAYSRRVLDECRANEQRAQKSRACGAQL